MSGPEKAEALAVLLRPFFEEQGETVVYSGECCGRLLVSVERPRTCGSCGRSPEVAEHTGTPVP